MGIANCVARGTEQGEQVLSALRREVNEPVPLVSPKLVVGGGAITYGDGVAQRSRSAEPCGVG